MNKKIRELEDSIEYKFDNFDDEETLNLTREEAEYIFSGKNCFCDVVLEAAGKTLIEYIKQLEADNYECNNIINDYIEERHKLIDMMKADRMEQLDDYDIYLIEKYLKELGVLEDE